MLKPGYFQRKYFPTHYWQENFQYWPHFSYRNKYVEIDDYKPLDKTIESILCFSLCINSNYSFIRFFNKEQYLLLDDDLYLCEI